MVNFADSLTGAEISKFLFSVSNINVFTILKFNVQIQNLNSHLYNIHNPSRVGTTVKTRNKSDIVKEFKCSSLPYLARLINSKK